MDGGGKAERFSLNETLRGLTKTKDFPLDGSGTLGAGIVRLFR